MIKGDDTMRSIFTFIFSWTKKIFRFIIGKVNPSKPDPEIDPGIDYPTEFVDYYGCPNSNRAKKLQMRKKRYRF